MNFTLFNEVMEAKNGSTEASLHILQSLKPLLLSNIKRYGLSQNLDDMLSEGNIEILKAVCDYDPSLNTPFLGLVKSRLRFLYLNMAKKKPREIGLDAPLSDSDGLTVMDILKDDGPLVEEQVLSDLDNQRLIWALSSLTPRQRQIVELYFIQGLSMVDISKALSLHYQTVVKIKDTALTNLKKAFFTMVNNC
jgi:RNA polymerase sporulation-specific sigma factor